MAATRSICRLELAKAQLAYGTWLREHRRANDARQHLAQAHAIATEAGAVGMQENAARLLAALGVEVATPERVTPPSRDLLTPQEQQVARLAAGGLTNKEIADRIYLSHRTVGTHLSNAYAKLGIRSRVQLMDVLGQ